MTDLLISGPALGGFAAGLGVCLVFLLSRSFFEVEQGHRAIVSSFGSAGGSQPKLLEPGAHFKYPWEKVHAFSVMERTMDLSDDENGAQVMTREGLVLRVRSKLRLRTLKDRAYSFVFGMDKPDEHIRELAGCMLRNEIANFHDEGQSSYSKLRSERQLLNLKLRQLHETPFADTYGLGFESLDLIDILPPEALTQALNAVQNAKADADSLYEITQAECETEIASADHGVAIAAERAKAVESEIETIGSAMESLQEGGTLQSYLERRKAESYSNSKLSFLKG